MHDVPAEFRQSPATDASRMQPAARSSVRRRPRWPLLVLLIATVAASVWGINEFAVARPVRAALKADSRNDGFTLRAHYRAYVLPGTLVLDLPSVRSAAPVDLLRGLFQSAATLATAGRRFDRVLLECSGEPVFLLSGEDFRTLGEESNAGENPLYLIRTLPEKLEELDGTPAYGTWTGGWLGVLQHQMDDANDAARRWAGGAPADS